MRKVGIIIFLSVLIAVVAYFIILANNQLPLISLSIGTQEQEGKPSTYCWGKQCVDGIILDLPDTEPLRYKKDDQFSFNIDTGRPPQSLSILVRDIVENLEDLPLDPSIITRESLSLDPSLKGEFSLSVPPGVYILVISGYWEEGDLSSVFKIEVQ